MKKIILIVTPLLAITGFLLFREQPPALPTPQAETPSKPIEAAISQNRALDLVPMLRHWPARSPRITAPVENRAQEVRNLVSFIQQASTSEDAAEREKALSTSLRTLVDLDPTAAAELLNQIPGGPFRDDYLIRFGHLWAAQDPAAALQWASDLTDEAERGSSLKTVCLEIGQVHPEAAIQAAEVLKVPHDHGTLDNLAQLWASKDLTAATRWALSRPPGESRDSLLARVAFVMAESSPREAANLLAKNVGPGEAQTEATLSVAHRWGLQDWNAAKQWVDQFPEGPLRDRVQKEMASIREHQAGIRKTQEVQ
jgi:hypothetical protein